MRSAGAATPRVRHHDLMSAGPRLSTDGQSIRTVNVEPPDRQAPPMRPLRAATSAAQSRGVTAASRSTVLENLKLTVITAETATISLVKRLKPPRLDRDCSDLVPVAVACSSAIILIASLAPPRHCRTGWSVGRVNLRPSRDGKCHVRSRRFASNSSRLISPRAYRCRKISRAVSERDRSP
jgi:hypothetical protein